MSHISYGISSHWYVSLSIFNAVSLSIATTESWKDKAGEKQEKTEWHNLTFYKRLAEIVGEYVKKGSEIYVEGKIQTRKWQDKEGKDRYTTEIICDRVEFLSKIEQATESYDATPVQPTQGTAAQSEQPPADDLPILT